MKKVLLVNDCKFESIVMKDKLEKLNFDVKISDELSALEKAAAYQPDVVIANLIMKNTQGNVLLGEIKSRYRNTVCILSSCSPVKKEQFDASQVDEVINTPVDENRLKSIMENYTVSVSKQMLYAFCPFCGEKLHNGNETIKFCPYCGQLLLNKVM